jgi:hypothetical protein
MNEENFSAEQSLKVIQSMIEKVKLDVAKNSFYFLLWGWLVFIAALLNFILMKFTDFEHPYIVWSLMVIGIVASIYKGIKEGNQNKVKTYLGETMKYFGISFGIIYTSLAFIFGKYNLWIYSFPIYILLYAVGCFFMGAMMHFSLLKWVGLFCLIIMVISVYVGHDWQILLMALAVLISYIIPGHILSAREKQINN